MVTTRSYLVRWAGYGPESNTWEPRSHLSPELIKEFEMDSDNYVYNWRHRCEICDLPCVSAKGVQIHKRKIHPDPLMAKTFKEGKQMWRFNFKS